MVADVSPGPRRIFTGAKSLSLKTVDELPFQPHEDTTPIDAPNGTFTADGFRIASTRLIMHKGARRHNFFAVFLFVQL